MYGMDKSKLCLMPHDAAWKDDFTAESERIKSAFDDRTLRIEHIGSTSIPTVCAKPILDLAILCCAKRLESLKDALGKLGYEFRGRYDEWDEAHFYAVLDCGNVRFCQAHIYTKENDDWRMKLKFRDCLREDLKLAKEYNDYKADLAKRVSNKTKYAEIKSVWVDFFILKIK